MFETQKKLENMEIKKFFYINLHQNDRLDSDDVRLRRSYNLNVAMFWAMLMFETALN